MKRMIYTINYPEDIGKKFQMFRYPAGEFQFRFTDEQLKEIDNCDEVHIFARIKDGEIMGLAQLRDALRATYSVVRLFLPYLPYSRADRAFTKGDCFGLHAFAGVLNHLDFDQIITLDMHSEVAEIEIDNLVNANPNSFIMDAYADLYKTNINIGIMLPDVGSQKRYQLNDSFVAGKKRDAITGKLIGFEVPSKEEFKDYDSILIVDDICDGGGTFLGIADQMKDYGLELNLYVTHGIFSKGLTDLFKRFNKIYTTNSFGTTIHAALEDKDRLITISCESVMLSAAETGRIFKGVR